MTAMLGFTGLGTEVGLWYFTKRTMQGAADTAAYSASTAAMAGATSTQLTTEGRSVAAKYGFADGAQGVSVAVNNPPKSGPYAGKNSAVEVIIKQPQTAILSELFLASPPTIQARAVSLTGVQGNGCVLALDRAAVNDVFDNGNTTVNLNSCSLYVNSSALSAVNLVGQAQINAYSAYIGGNYTTSGSGQLNTTHGINVNQQPINDPYANVSMPAPSGPNLGTISNGNYSPGTYSGISSNGGTINLAPGVYVIDSGGIDIYAGTKITGTGVTIVLTSSSNTYGTITIRSGSTLTLTAPTSGPTAGLAIMQDRNAPQSNSNTFAGGPQTQVTGVIYLPNEPVFYAGGTDTGGAICTQLVALTITFRGNSSFNNNCSLIGTKNIGNQPTQLVE